MSDLALAVAAFGIGMLVSVLGLAAFQPEDPDLGPFAVVIFGLPLMISPFLYIPGYLLQEARLPARPRRIQLASALLLGMLYVLLLWGALELSEALESVLVLPEWLGSGAMIVLWFIGPALIAIGSMRVERRLVRRLTRNVEHAG